MAEIIGDTACPSCRKHGGDSSGNHLMLFADGGAYCNRCEYSESAETFTPIRVDFGEEKSEEVLEAERNEVLEYPFFAIPERKISKEVCDRFGVRSSLSTTNRDKVTAHYFPRCSDNKLQGFKIRFLSGKNFGKAGKSKDSEFFGLDQCPKQGRKLFITEGEYDAMCLYESFLKHTKEEWVTGISIVSLSNGSGGVKKDVIKNKEFLSNYSEIICVFDQDDPGRKAAEDFKQALPDKTVIYARYKGKDPCEALQKGDHKELYFACITGKQVVRPEKIIYGEEISLEELLTPLKKGLEVPYKGLMEKMHGFRHGEGGGELTIVTAGTGMGKTTLAREIMYCFNKTHKLKLGNIFLEEQRRKTGQSYIAIDNNVPLGKLREDPSCIPLEDFKKSYKELIANGRCIVLDHFGSLASDTLMDHMYYLHYEGCQFILLDHISMVISGQENGKNGERKDIDILMTKLAAFCEDTGTSVFAVVHLKRPATGCFNEGQQVSLSHLRGSAAIEQLSHNILSVEGDQHGDSPNKRIVRVLKNREWGDVGEADTLEYIPETGRLLPCKAVEFGGTNY